MQKYRSTIRNEFRKSTMPPQATEEYLKNNCMLKFKYDKENKCRAMNPA